ncbi:PREDICTED: uncharacterized protein LOC108576045 [Habropoda laboriosa]|uniref:uncharacterized protein LOC108576045 n=1 Tax=Habropoda laboriosa TaxID=597456 RepID=UPI00083CC4C6|nr:PREDICTED: uncharacterized protein LOC108576045 [Habropoda laboriosa]
MFTQKQSYFSRLAKSYPILKLVDIYDRQSFIRAYVLDNLYICILMHAFFYLALWCTTTVIKKMERSNKEMLKIVEDNRTKLDDVMAMKDKKEEYDEMVVKVKETQKLTSEEIDNQMQRLSSELITAADKLSELERILEKFVSSGKTRENSACDVSDGQRFRAKENHEGRTNSFEDLKILEPSFPPPQPPEPPPRKYGIFVSRPPGQRRPSPAAAAASPKIGFK